MLMALVVQTRPLFALTSYHCVQLKSRHYLNLSSSKKQSFYFRQDLIKMLVGNKIDKEGKEVSTEEGKRFAKRYAASRVLEADAEAVVFVSRFQIGGWDSY